MRGGDPEDEGQGRARRRVPTIVPRPVPSTRHVFELLHETAEQRRASRSPSRWTRGPHEHRRRRGASQPPPGVPTGARLGAAPATALADRDRADLDDIENAVRLIVAFPAARARTELFLASESRRLATARASADVLSVRAAIGQGTEAKTRAKRGLSRRQDCARGSLCRPRAHLTTIPSRASTAGTARSAARPRSRRAEFLHPASESAGLAQALLAGVGRSVIVSAVRTPFGKLGGGLAGIEATKLGGIAIRAALDRVDVRDDEVEYVIMGQVLQGGAGQAPARQAAVAAGLPIESPPTRSTRCARRASGRWRSPTR